MNPMIPIYVSLIMNETVDFNIDRVPLNLLEDVKKVLDEKGVAY